MTAEERAELIAPDAPQIERLSKMALELVSSPLAYRGKYIALRSYTDRAMEKILPQTPCRRGCSACCHMALPIPQLEAERLAKVSGRRPNQIAPNDDPAAALAMFGNVQRFRGVPCPFLKDNACTVYEERPISCRSHHVLENDAAKCDTRTSELTAAFDVGWTAYVHANIVPMGEGWADIREWFT